MTDIREITAYGLSSPLDPPLERQFPDGYQRTIKRDMVLVKFETADGEVGYAPAGASPSMLGQHYEEPTLEHVVNLINTVVAPTLRGANPDDIEGARESLSDITLPGFLKSQLVAAIDVALYDIAGKRAGAPIYELLTEEEGVTPDLSLYASGGQYLPPDELVEQATRMSELGFGAFKYRAGFGVETDRHVLAELVETVGDEMDIMVDCHLWWEGGESYDVATVQDLVADFQDHGVYWVEEPVAPGRYEEYKILAETTNAPLAGGENEESVQSLIALAESGAVDFVQVDTPYHEGYTGCLRVAKRCAELDLAFTTHNFGSLLGLVTNAHLLAATPNEMYFQCPTFLIDESSASYSYPLATEILKDDLDLSGGRFSVPDGPGLGVEIDLAVVEEYSFIDGPWTEFHYE
ncbi:L-alanine-DL-glutamate epimerase [Halogranum amylolyticum]|uniref:glucarate dehydratase n=1 Tax=Halogranum amylolyticum TaxID=660520 RepID=A0A1H8TFE9_9EURY|nr:mandelate racemase/muconate lactonizing enzyme family protein [Halogranum amylolyticum]SEO89820.1 L-alanine-DL-glutamate epimerase [Halogranum amylolyticum]